MPPLPLKTRLLNVVRLPLRTAAVDGVVATLTRGRSPRSLPGRIPPAHDLYRPGSVRRVERFGVRFHLDLSEHQDWWTYYGFSHPLLELVDRVVEPGMVCADVGANMGYTSFYMARAVGESGRVLAFEPFPATAERFRANLALNRLPQVDFHPVALGEESGRVGMVEPDPRHPGRNYVASAEAGGEGRPRETAEAPGESGPGTASPETRPEVPSMGHARSATVEVRTLDQVIEAVGVTRLDLVKVDVEGYEGRVLAGARHALERFRPLLVLEMNADLLRRQGTQPGTLVEELEGLGYGCVTFPGGAPVDRDFAWEGRHLDVLARPGGD